MIPAELMESEELSRYSNGILHVFEVTFVLFFFRFNLNSWKEMSAFILGSSGEYIFLGKTLYIFLVFQY